MSPKSVSIVAGILLFFAGSASAGILDSTTAANDSATDFARRIPDRQFPAAQIREAEMTGWTLYRYEALADSASYIFASQVADPSRKTIAGSVVLPGTQWRVRFYCLDASDNPLPAGDVVFSGSGSAEGSVVPRADAAPFSEAETAMIRAQELVLSTTRAPCEGIYKTVTLPAGNGNFMVYRLRESLNSSQVPEGQHLRYEVLADGSTIAGQYESSRRCNVLPSQYVPDTKAKEVRFTDPYDDAPNEIHVYLSLRYRSTFYMLTSRTNRYWSVTSGVVTPD
jgi:hypothetical protein